MVARLLIRHQRSVRRMFWVTLVMVVALSLLPTPIEAGYFVGEDKAEHFLAYLALGALLGTGWRLSRARPLLRGFLALVLLGGVIELVQGISVIDRTPSWFDWLSDALGAIFALAAVAWFWRRWHHPS